MGTWARIWAQLFHNFVHVPLFSCNQHGLIDLYMISHNSWQYLLQTLLGPITQHTVHCASSDSQALSSRSALRGRLALSSRLTRPGRRVSCHHVGGSGAPQRGNPTPAPPLLGPPGVHDMPQTGRLAPGCLLLHQRCNVPGCAETQPSRPDTCNGSIGPKTRKVPQLLRVVFGHGIVVTSCESLR